MKIVVIGGSGLIGTKLVHKLRQLGHEVVAASPRTVKIFVSFLSTVIMSGNMAIFEMDDRSGETAFNLEYIPVYSRVMKRVVNRKPLGGGRSQ